eukprot:UN05729
MLALFCSLFFIMSHPNSTEGKECDTHADDPMEILTDFFLENSNNVPAKVTKAFNVIRKGGNKNDKFNQILKQSSSPIFKPYTKYYIIGPNGKCIHLDGFTDSNGAKITQWDKVNQDNLKWFISPVYGDDGYFHIISAASGKVLHNHGGGKGNGAKCTTWRIGPEPNLRVRFEKVYDDQYKDHEYWYLIFKDSNKCVHNHGGANKSGAAITP